MVASSPYLGQGWYRGLSHTLRSLGTHSGSVLRRCPIMFRESCSTRDGTWAFCMQSILWACCTISQPWGLYFKSFLQYTTVDLHRPWEWGWSWKAEGCVPCDSIPQISPLAPWKLPSPLLFASLHLVTSSKTHWATSFKPTVKGAFRTANRVPDDSWIAMVSLFDMVDSYHVCLKRRPLLSP